MAVKVDKEKCIGCGACESVAPEIFGMEETDAGMKAHVKKQPEGNKEKSEAKEAQEGCPVDAISGA